MHREPTAPRPLEGRLAGGLVFLSGGAVLVLEIVSLRLVAPFVGLTLQTSTAVIGVALLAIAVGAWAGGRAADEVDPARLLPPALLAAGAATMATLPVVRWAGELTRGGDVSAVLLVAAAAVFVPAALLSSVTPLVVKLRLRDLGHTGRVVGQLSGLGTLGAIVATFTTGFVLVAALPSSATLVTLGVVLVAAGLALGVRLRQRAPGALLAVGGLALPLALLAPAPCDVETAYHCARVVADPARPSGRVLELDTLRHSYVDLADPGHLEFRYVRAMAALTDVVAPAGEPLRALHLGGGGFTLPRYVEATRPGSRSTVLEIDGGVVALAERALGLRLGEGVRAEVGDARTLLDRQPRDAWDVVVGDAFGGFSVPWHLTTEEFTRAVGERLDGDGVYVLNIIDNPPNRFVAAELATLSAVFDHVAVLVPEAGGGNHVAVASDAPLPLSRLSARLRERGVAGRLLSGEELRGFVGDARVLRDDHAPVDQLLTPFTRTRR